MTHRRAESGPLCSSSSSPSCPLALLIRTGAWRTGGRSPGSGSDPPGRLCWSGWRNSVCGKAPYLCMSERCCSFLGTLRVPSPTTPIWRRAVCRARGTPRGWGGRTGSSAAWCVDGKPAHVQEKGLNAEAAAPPRPPEVARAARPGATHSHDSTGLRVNGVRARFH